MSYTKQTFTDYSTVLNKSIMNHIEDGIYHSQEVPNEILDNSFICSYGGIKNTGYVKNTSGIYGCTMWLHCADSATISVRMMIETSNSGYGLAFYDGNKTLLSFVNNNVGAAAASEIRELEVPEGAVYFRTTYYSYANLGSQEDFYASIPHSSDYFANGKKAYQEGQINYSVFVNQTCPDVTSVTQDNQDVEEIKSSMCVLCLPSNYSPIGKPTPSIILCMGANGYITYEDFRGNPDTWIQFVELLNQAGYAVIGCQGGYDNAGSYVKPSGSPPAVHAHHKAFEWAKKHYNLAEKTNYCGCSMGGLIAMNAPLLYNNEIQTVSMMAGMIDSYAQGWVRQSADAKTVMTKYYGFSSSSTYEADKVGNYNPMTRIKTVNDTEYVFNAFPPTKMWHGKQDTTLHEYALNQQYVNAMKNTGLIADMRMIDGCDHGLARGVYVYNNVTYTNAAEELIAFLNRYNSTNIVPTLEEKPVVTYTFTITPTPATATVTLSATGYTSVSGTGNQSITVVSGTSVSYKVSNDGYISQSNSYTVKNDYELAISLTSDNATYTDITSLFDFTLYPTTVCNLGASLNSPRFQSSLYFDSTLVDVSTYAGKTIKITIPQYTNSNGGQSCNATILASDATPTYASTLHVWETYGEAKTGVLTEYTLALPSDAKYLYTSIFNDAAVAEGIGNTGFYCKVAE